MGEKQGPFFIKCPLFRGPHLGEVSQLLTEFPALNSLGHLAGEAKCSP